MKKIKSSTLFMQLCVVTVCSLVAVNASAAPSLSSSTCEYRADKNRSKADGRARGLTPGGGYTFAVAGAISPSRVANLAGEASNSFDSDPGDIRTGDTAIANIAVRGGSATFVLRNALGTEVARSTIACRMR
jgi:hypothetical protein